MNQPQILVFPPIQVPLPNLKSTNQPINKPTNQPTNKPPVTTIPSSTHSSVTYEYSLLIRHPAEERLLLLPKGDGWTLPWFRHKERHFWQEVAHINAAVMEMLGLRATTLRCLDTTYDPTQDRVSSSYALESQDAQWPLPPGARWADAGDLDAISLAQPELTPALCDWLDFRQPQETQPNRAAWYEPGWFAQAESWMTLALAQMGRSLSSPVVQVRVWQRSCLLRAETDGGPVYFKAVPPIFAHEPAITHALAARYPQHIPTVLARHPRLPWFLMAQVDGVSLTQRQDIAIWESALRTFALIQIDLAGRVERLVELGCPQRDLAQMPDQMAQLLDDAGLLLPSRPAGLGDEDRATIRAMLPALGIKARRLAEIKLPQTLEHGDFWPGQVLIVDHEPPAPPQNSRRPPLSQPSAPSSHPVFIDWSDCSIAHPFFSLSLFDDIVEMEGYLSDVPKLRERLRNAYLGPWTVYAPMKELIEAFELARPLAAIHNALIYQQTILPGMEQRWEMHYMPAFFLKKLLHNYDRAVVV